MKRIAAERDTSSALCTRSVPPKSSTAGHFNFVKIEVSREVSRSRRRKIVKLGVKQPQTLLFQPCFSQKPLRDGRTRQERYTSISLYTRSVAPKCHAVRTARCYHAAVEAGVRRRMTML